MNYKYKQKKTWEKNLYGNKNYPDNYTDETFLKELKKNIEFKDITLLECIKGATVVAKELCIVVLFVLVFVYLHNKWIDPKTVFGCTSMLTLIGFLYYRLVFGKSLTTTVKEDIRTLLIFLVFGYIFSPVMHTLTDTVSTDTIYTMTFLMMCAHLIFFDYGLPAALVSNCLSLNAAIFGSICLASRLASPYHAFVLMTIAVQSFVLFPVLHTKIKSCILAACILVTITIYLLYTVSFTITVLFTLTLVFINFVCPFFFVRWQRFKENIYGPWDEAIVQDVNNVNQLRFI